MPTKNPQALLKGLQWFQRARELLAAGARAEAARAFEQASALIPEHPGLLAEYGAFAESVPDWVAAERLYARLVALTGGADARLHLANAVYRQERLDDALPLARAAADALPGNAAAFALLGNCLHKLGRPAEAIDAARRALAIEDQAGATGLLLRCLMETGRRDEFDALVEDARRRFPEDWQIRHLRADHLLQSGDYARGFPETAALREHSVRAGHWYRRIGCEPWDGRPFAGRLLVCAEQGIGDEVLASSMYGDLVAMGQAATIECDPRLMPALHRAFPALAFVPRGEERLAELAAAGGDFRKVLAIDLPAFLRRSPADFPARDAWLQPDPVRAAAIRARYDALFGDRLRVGISWNSKRPYPNATKSLPLDQFAPLLADPRLALLNLQYGDAAAEVAALGEAGERLYRDPDIDPFHDIEGLLAQLSCLDMLVSCSNTTVHLAGALGVRTWVLLPRHWPVLWYWGYAGETTPWYPSIRLWRNPEERRWDVLFARLARELQGLAHIG